MDDCGRTELEAQALALNHGAVFRGDAAAAGMSRAQIDRRIRKGQWVPLGPRGWYGVASMADRPLTCLYAATRALDGPAWGVSALALFDLADHPPQPIVASRRRYSGTGVDRVQVHGLDALPRTTVDGIDTVTAAVAVVAAGRWHGDQTELHLLIDNAIRNRVTTWSEVEEVLREFPRMGRGGSTRMREVLADHEIDPALPLSDWGRTFVVGLIEAGVPRPMMEYRVVDARGELVAQVDAGYPALRYAIELDSREFHLNERAFEVDRQRDADLARLGWLVRRFTWKQWRLRQRWVLETIDTDLTRCAHRPHPGHQTHLAH